MTQFIGVVPIFVNAGAAVLPAVLGALASAAALLLKPRELLALCRQRPVIPVASVLIIIAACCGIWLLSGNSSASTRASASTVLASRTDWAKVALDYIRQEKLQTATDETGLPSTAPAAKGPVVLGHDYSRCGYDGGTVPSKLQLLWAHTQEDAWFLSSPAVIGGRVYCGSCRTDVTGKTGTLFLP